MHASNQPRYKLPVKVGNWVEETTANELQPMQFLFNLDKNKLSMQTIRKMTLTMLKEARLTPTSGPLYYGLQVQLLITPPYSPIKIPKYNSMVLSGFINEREVDWLSSFHDGCGLTVTTLLTPAVKNVFKICGPRGKHKDGEILRYGDQFSLSPTESQTGDPLYLAAEMYSSLAVFGRSNHPRVIFSSKPDRYSAWEAVHPTPGLRCRINGKPIQGNTNLLIKHCATNVPLAAEMNFWHASFLGVECEATIHSYIGQGNLYPRENMWRIITERVDKD